MVQSTNFRQLGHRTQLRRLNGACFRSVLGKRKVSAGTPIVPEIKAQCLPQGGFIKDQQVVQALAPDRALPFAKITVVPNMACIASPTFQLRLLNRIRSSVPYRNLSVVAACELPITQWEARDLRQTGRRALRPPARMYIYKDARRG